MGFFLVCIFSIDSIRCFEDGPCVEEWKLVDVAKFDHLGSNGRVQGKIEKILQFAREAAKSTSCQQVSSDEISTLREALQAMMRDIEVN